MNASVMALEISDLPPPETVAGLWHEVAVGDGADEGPGARVVRLLGHRHPVAAGAEVDLVGAQRHRPGATVLARPGDGHVVHRVVRATGNQHDVRLLAVVGVPLGLRDEPLGVALEHLGERVGVPARLLVVLLAEVVAGEHQGATGVLLLRVAEQVRGVGDLGLDLLLAVAEVGVGDDGDDHAARVAGADLERPPAVVQLVLGLPAHAVALLALGGLAEVRQARPPSWSPGSGAGRGRRSRCGRSTSPEPARRRSRGDRGRRRCRRSPRRSRGSRRCRRAR